ncbi:MAG: hypothetical protein ACREKL_12615, partial [Chthoniobacterales bacterium]
MKRICVGIVVAVVCVWNVQAQSILQQKKKEVEFYTPATALGQKLHPNLTDQEIRDYHWQVREDTMPSELKIVRNVVTSETTPWLSARSLWGSETMVQRSAERGAGELSKRATEEAKPIDRWLASQMPEQNYPGKSQDDAILAAVYRHFFGYRARGFGRDTTVYFLGLGPHAADAPPSVVAGLESDPTIKHDGVKLRPVSKSLEVTDDAIRDRDTGEYGV